MRVEFDTVFEFSRWLDEYNYNWIVAEELPSDSLELTLQKGQRAIIESRDNGIYVNLLGEELEAELPRLAVVNDEEFDNLSIAEHKKFLEFRDDDRFLQIPFI